MEPNQQDYEDFFNQAFRHKGNLASVIDSAAGVHPIIITKAKASLQELEKVLAEHGPLSRRAATMASFIDILRNTPATATPPGGGGAATSPASSSPALTAGEVLMLDELKVVVYCSTAQTQEFLENSLKSRPDLYLHVHPYLWALSYALPDLLVDDLVDLATGHAMNYSHVSMVVDNWVLTLGGGVVDESVQLNQSTWPTTKVWLEACVQYFRFELSPGTPLHALIELFENELAQQAWLRRERRALRATYSFPLSRALEAVKHSLCSQSAYIRLGLRGEYEEVKAILRAAIQYTDPTQPVDAQYRDVMIADLLDLKPYFEDAICVCDPSDFISHFLKKWCAGQSHNLTKTPGDADARDEATNKRTFPMRYLDALPGLLRDYSTPQAGKVLSQCPMQGSMLFPRQIAPPITTQQDVLKFDSMLFYPLGSQVQLVRHEGKMYKNVGEVRYGWNAPDNVDSSSRWGIKEDTVINVEWHHANSFAGILEKLDHQKVRCVDHITDSRSCIMTIDEMREAYGDLDWSEKDYADLMLFLTILLNQDIRQGQQLSTETLSKRLVLPKQEYSQVEAYKALRFLTQFQEYQLPWLNAQVVETGLEEVRQSWKGDVVIDRACKALKMATRADLEWERGMLFYGPPGTGKTVFVDKLASRVGFTLVAPPFPGAQINGGLVGDNEKVLRDLFTRGRMMPWAPVCFAIDEMEVIAPNRLAPGNRGGKAENQDAISVLLSEYGGISDVKNAFVMGCTNRKRSMDPAVLRPGRSDTKIFVGVPDVKVRREMLSACNLWASDVNMEDRPPTLEEVVGWTTNFSGAELKKLLKHVHGLVEEAREGQPMRRPTREEVMDVVRELCEEENILIGRMSLVDILKANKIEDDPARDISFSLTISEHLVQATGRIVVDIRSTKLQDLAIYVETGLQDGSRVELRRFPLYPDCSPTAEVSNPSQVLHKVISVFSNFAVNSRVEASYLQYFDVDTFNSKDAIQEPDQVAVLEEAQDYSHKYGKSVVMFRLDSLALFSQREKMGGDDDGDAYGLSQTQHRIMNKVFDFFMDHVNDGARQRWMVAIASSEATYRYLKDQTKWPDTALEKKMERELDRTRQCFYCGKAYQQRTNTDDHACRYHGDEFDIDGPTPQILWVKEAEGGGGANRAMECDRLPLDALGTLRFPQVRWTLEGDKGLNPELYSRGERANCLINARNAWSRTPWKLKDAFYTCCNGGITSQGCREGLHSDRSREGPLIVIRAQNYDMMEQGFAQDALAILHKHERGDIDVCIHDLEWLLNLRRREGMVDDDSDSLLLLLDLVLRTIEEDALYESQDMNGKRVERELHEAIEVTVEVWQASRTHPMDMNMLWGLMKKVKHQSHDDIVDEDGGRARLVRRCSNLVKLWSEFKGMVSTDTFLYRLAEVNGWDYRNTRRDLLREINQANARLSYTMEELRGFDYSMVHDLLLTTVDARWDLPNERSQDYDMAITLLQQSGRVQIVASA